MKEFNEFLEEQIKSGYLERVWNLEGRQEEEEVLASLEDGDNAFQLQAESLVTMIGNR